MQLLELLVLAILCAVNPRLAPSDSLELLTEELNSSSRQKRRSAVRRLAGLESEEAWALVVGALRDADGAVGDEAEFRLRELPHEALVSELLGRGGIRGKDALLVSRAAGVLAELDHPVDPVQLLRALASNAPDAKADLLCALGDRGARFGREVTGDRPSSRARRSVERTREQVFKRLLKLHDQSRDPQLAGEALLAAVHWSEDPEETRELVKLAQRAATRKEIGLRRAGLLAARELPRGADGIDRQSLLEPLLADSQVAVRLLAVDACAWWANRAHVGLLVDALEVEAHPRVQRRILLVLQSLSGLRHRLDPRPWRDWAHSLGVDWTGRSPDFLHSHENSPGGLRTGARLGGLSILSDRVIFLVDFSGSLWMKRGDGTIRKTFADKAMREALMALPDTAHFNVIPYTSRPHPWKERLVRATRRNKREAIEWFEACRERGSGDFFEAASLALEDPDVDTVLTFTDGLPTGGPRCRLELMVPTLLRRARLRGVAFDTLLVGAPHRLLRHWRRLANETAGQVLAIDVD